MMERTGIDRRPGLPVTVKQPTRTSRFAHLARSGPAEEPLLNSSSGAFATFIALAVLYGVDRYFWDGQYGGTAWKVVQQIGRAFGF